MHQYNIMELNKFLSINGEKFESLRRELHQFPEVAGAERNTASRINAFFTGLGGFERTTDVGGCGLWATLDSGNPGKHTVFRAELDALPIYDGSGKIWSSVVEGHGHQCGHDGHMAILCGLGAYLAVNPPVQGKVSFLFQPAEETGQGSTAMIDDPKFACLQPDCFIALHNIPGLKMGSIALKSSAICVASAGVEIHIKGRSSHAAEQEKGLNPWSTLKQIADYALTIPSEIEVEGQIAKVTLAGLHLGDKRFGTSPGHGRVWLTLRSTYTETLNQMISRLRSHTTELVLSTGCEFEFAIEDRFESVFNDAELTNQFTALAETAGFELTYLEAAFSWSEDFGQFSRIAPTFFFGLGSGLHQPPLHAPDYDFPDELIPVGIRALNLFIDQDHR
jgi:amidohydrolase